MNAAQERVIEEIAAFEAAARAVVNDRTLDRRSKLLALVALGEAARQATLPEFARAGVSRIAEPFLEGRAVAPGSPDPVVAAARALRHAGYARCPRCRQRIPAEAELDRHEGYRAVAYLEAKARETGR